jgi:dipeptidase D
MQEKIIEHFITLTKIPHCSKEADQLLNFLVDFSKERGYSVETDVSKNILIKKGNPKLALQAHYDMVCMGEAPKIETHIEEGWMSAKASSLGADNGIAIAMMMVLMERGEELEFLLTSDEEIGLIGASALAFSLKSRQMLNLDFEDDAEVCIGCAGGADLLASKRLSTTKPYGHQYRVSLANLQGGHSGVDIDKGIPNAIKLLVDFLQDKEVSISSFQGGERRNSIPANATMLLSSLEPLEGTEMIQVEAIEEAIRPTYDAHDFLSLVMEFEDGVNAFNEEFSLPDSSINLAIVSIEEGVVSIESSARAMSDSGLEAICQKNMQLFEKHGFDAKQEFKYPSWRPEINDFTKSVHETMSGVFGKSKYTAIHAGLECGVILQRYPHIKFASIGPTICHPHSTREKVNVDSVGKIFEVVEGVLAKL